MVKLSDEIKLKRELDVFKFGDKVVIKYPNSHVSFAQGVVVAVNDNCCEVRFEKYGGLHSIKVKPYDLYKLECMRSKWV